MTMSEVVREGTMTAHLYQTKEGNWVVADQCGWYPGSYSTRDEALAAIRRVNGIR